MISIFADHCVGKFFIESLRQSGTDVLMASEIGMDRATDEEIFEYALAKKRILISFDRDFINIARFNIKAAAGVVIFEIYRLSRETIKKRIVDFFHNNSAARLKGRLFVFDLGGTINIWPQN
jgi:predicted nuclease of predicted toxin-antitoxin system